MPLSADPDKRGRQLANLQKGGPAAAQRHGLVSQEAPFAESANGPEHEMGGGRDELPVVGYGQLEEQPPAPAPDPPEGVGVEHALAPDEIEVDLEPGDEDEGEEFDERQDDDDDDERAPRGGLGGLMDGFLGR